MNKDNYLETLYRIHSFAVETDDSILEEVYGSKIDQHMKHIASLISRALKNNDPAERERLSSMQAYTMDNLSDHSQHAAYQDLDYDADFDMDEAKALALVHKDDAAASKKILQLAKNTRDKILASNVFERLISGQYKQLEDLLNNENYLKAKKLANELKPNLDAAIIYCIESNEFDKAKAFMDKLELVTYAASRRIIDIKIEGIDFSLFEGKFNDELKTIEEWYEILGLPEEGLRFFRYKIYITKNLVDYEKKHIDGKDKIMVSFDDLKTIFRCINLPRAEQDGYIYPKDGGERYTTIRNFSLDHNIKNGAQQYRVLNENYSHTKIRGVDIIMFERDFYPESILKTVFEEKLKFKEQTLGFPSANGDGVLYHENEEYITAHNIGKSYGFSEYIIKNLLRNPIKGLINGKLQDFYPKSDCMAYTDLILKLEDIPYGSECADFDLYSYTWCTLQSLSRRFNLSKRAVRYLLELVPNIPFLIGRGNENKVSLHYRLDVVQKALEFSEEIQKGKYSVVEISGKKYATDITWYNKLGLKKSEIKKLSQDYALTGLKVHSVTGFVYEEEEVLNALNSQRYSKQKGEKYATMSQWAKIFDADLKSEFDSTLMSESEFRALNLGKKVEQDFILLGDKKYRTVDSLADFLGLDCQEFRYIIIALRLKGLIYKNGDSPILLFEEERTKALLENLGILVDYVEIDGRKYATTRMLARRYSRDQDFFQYTIIKNYKIDSLNCEFVIGNVKVYAIDQVEAILENHRNAQLKSVEGTLDNDIDICLDEFKSIQQISEDLKLKASKVHRIIKDHNIQGVKTRAIDGRLRNVFSILEVKEALGV